MEVTRSACFKVEVPEQVHVDRDDGGHLVIHPLTKVKDRTQLSPDQAKDLIRLTMVVGEAMQAALNQRGIDVQRINYQDNGNWGVFDEDGPTMHEHLYGRARSAKLQPFGQALHLPDPSSGFYKGLRPLSGDDVAAIRREIARLLRSPKYISF